MRELISSLIMPLPLLYLLLITAAVLYILKKRRPAFIFVLISGSWFLLISTPPIPILVIKSLENRYTSFQSGKIDELTFPVNLMVLGGGHTNDEKLPPNDQLSLNALGRLSEGFRLQRLMPGSTLILSGYGGDEEITQAEVLFRTAISLGVDSSSVFLLHKPENTWMEALEYAKHFDHYQTLILVTDAVHMPRAMMLFHKASLSPIPAPTNHILKKSDHNNIRWLPSAGYISYMESAIHEYAGMLWASIRY